MGSSELRKKQENITWKQKLTGVLGRKGSGGSAGPNEGVKALPSTSPRALGSFSTTTSSTSSSSFHVTRSRSASMESSIGQRSPTPDQISLSEFFSEQVADDLPPVPEIPKRFVQCVLHKLKSELHGPSSAQASSVASGPSMALASATPRVVSLAFGTPSPSQRSASGMGAPHAERLLQGSPPKIGPVVGLPMSSRSLLPPYAPSTMDIEDCAEPAPTQKQQAMICQKQESMGDRSLNNPAFPSASHPQMTNRDTAISPEASRGHSKHQASSRNLKSDAALPGHSAPSHNLSRPAEDREINVSRAIAKPSLPRAIMADIDEEWWNDAVNYTRQRMMQDAEAERKNVREKPKVARDAGKGDNGKLKGAKRMTECLVERSSQYGVHPMKPVEEMTKADLEYVAENSGTRTLGKIRDLLFPKKTTSSVVSTKSPRESDHKGMRSNPPQPEPEIGKSTKHELALRLLEGRESPEKHGWEKPVGLGITGGEGVRVRDFAAAQIADPSANDAEGDTSARPATPCTLSKSVNSDAASVFSSITPKRLEKRFGSDFSPHSSTFAPEASRYLESKHPGKQQCALGHNSLLRDDSSSIYPEDESTGWPASPTQDVLGANRHLSEPDRVKMTCSQRRKIDALKSKRQDELREMDSHPCLRSEPKRISRLLVMKSLPDLGQHPAMLSSPEETPQKPKNLQIGPVSSPSLKRSLSNQQCVTASLPNLRQNCSASSTSFSDSGRPGVVRAVGTSATGSPLTKRARVINSESAMALRSLHPDLVSLQGNPNDSSTSFSLDARGLPKPPIPARSPLRLLMSNTAIQEPRANTSIVREAMLKMWDQNRTNKLDNMFGSTSTFRSAESVPMGGLQSTSAKETDLQLSDSSAGPSPLGGELPSNEIETGRANGQGLHDTVSRQVTTDADWVEVIFTTPQKREDTVVGERELSKSNTGNVRVEIDDIIREWQDRSPVPDRDDERSEAWRDAAQSQDLRRQFGLLPLRGPQSGEPRHPNHPFEWHGSKLMCRRIHNPQNILPALPSFPMGEPVHMSSVDAQYFVGSPYEDYRSPTKCARPDCANFCCHYGKLFARSGVPTTDVIAVSALRHLENESRRLKSRTPNGVEEWDAFVKCSECEKVFCPDCSWRCVDQLCQQLICYDCMTTTGHCFLHELL